MMIFSLTPDDVVTFMLVLIRIGGIILTAPLFSHPRVPPPLRMGIALLLTFLLRPVIAVHFPEASGSVVVLALLVIKEALTGVIIGYTANLVFSVVQMAGEMQDTQAGFSLANTMDPTLSPHSAILGQFQLVLMWLLFFAVKGHQVLIQGIADSFVVIPLGTASFDGVLTLQMTGMVTSLLLLALRISAPVIGAVLLADLAVGMIQRTAPQLNLLAIGFQVKIAVAVLALTFALPFILLGERGLVPLLGSQVFEMTRLLSGR